MILILVFWGGSTVYAEYCPNLQYVCTDEDKIYGYVQQFAIFEMNVNSYCSFVPAGGYNELTGVLTDNLEDNGCNANNNIFVFNKISIDDGENIDIAYTSNSSDYLFYTAAGNFVITPSLENPSYFNANPLEATVDFSTESGEVANQDFCFTANGVHSDLEIVLASTEPARPGFDAEYYVIYKNKGNQIATGEINFDFDDDVLDYVSATESPITENYGVITWQYTDLLPFESRSFIITLNVNAPTETPAVNIGDILNFSTTINPIEGDEQPEDNQFNLEQVVVGAYDPNDITCLEGNILEPDYIGKYLHYLINFENTGNAPAENVVVAMNVDTTLYNLNSLELLNRSHDMNVRVNGNKVEFIFESIFLEPLEKGSIVFKMKAQETLQVGDTITQHAEIFFDYNFPIITNTASTTFAVLNTPEFLAETALAIYPNPFNEVLTIKAKTTIKVVEIYDVQGRIVFSKELNNTEITLNITKQSQGIYFAKISTDKGIKIEKIIKK